MVGLLADRGKSVRIVALTLATIALIAPTSWAAPRPSTDAPETLYALSEDPIADLAANLDYDLDQIYQYVADEIQYEPYAGILRGARGTLTAEAGNSTDQSLLLAALLDESLIEYRFARGALDERTAAELARSALIDASAARARADRILVGELDTALEGIALADASESPQAATIAAALDETLELASSRIDDSVNSIGSALAQADIELPGMDVSLPTSEVEGHIWVQVSFGAEWLDLDPSFNGLDAGDAATVASETLDELPDELRHLLAFEVLLERVRGGDLATEQVLEFSAYADQLAGVALTFGHIKPVGFERLGIVVRNLLGSGGVQYNPAFDVAGQSLVGAEAVTFGTADSEGGGGLLADSELFASDGSSTEAVGPPEGEATAEWLQVRYTPPLGEPVTARRTIFDRVPASQRFGAEPVVESIAPIELVDLDGTGELDFAPMMSAWSFAVATAPTPGTALIARVSERDPSALATMALAHHYLRDALATEVLLGQGVHTFIDAPEVASVSMDVDAQGPEPLVRLKLDIWHRSAGTLPLAGGEPLTSRSRVMAGVLGHVAERVAMDQGAGGQVSEQGGPVGIGRLFEASAAAGIPTIAITDMVPGDAGYGAQATTLMRDALAAGDVVVAPARPVLIGGRDRIGFWRVDPVTGESVDVMDGGGGQETTEYQIPLTRSFKVASCLFALSGSILAGVVEILDLGGLNTAKHGVSIAAIVFQSFSAARGWTGSCK